MQNLLKSTKLAHMYLRRGFQSCMKSVFSYPGNMLQNLHTLLLLVGLCSPVQLITEPTCSKYDFEERVLEKLVRMEHTVEQFSQRIQEVDTKIDQRIQEVDTRINQLPGMCSVLLVVIIIIHIVCIPTMHCNITIYDKLQFTYINNI